MAMLSGVWPIDDRTSPRTSGSMLSLLPDDVFASTWRPDCRLTWPSATLNWPATVIAGAAMMTKPPEAPLIAAPAATSTGPSACGGSMIWLCSPCRTMSTTPDTSDPVASRPLCRKLTPRDARSLGTVSKRVLPGRCTSRVAAPISRLEAINDRTLTCAVGPKNTPFWLMTTTVPSALIDPRIELGRSRLKSAIRPVAGSMLAAMRLTTTQSGCCLNSSVVSRPILKLSQVSKARGAVWVIVTVGVAALPVWTGVDAPCHVRNPVWSSAAATGLSTGTRPPATKPLGTVCASACAAARAALLACAASPAAFVAAA